MDFIKKVIMVCKICYWNYKDKLFPTEIKIMEEKIGIYKLKHELHTKTLAQYINKNTDIYNSVVKENCVNEELKHLWNQINDYKSR
jgi:hypothetical protein